MSVRTLLRSRRAEARPSHGVRRLPKGTMLVEARSVWAALCGNEVLRGVDLCVRAGEVVALVGPNGAGKSTLLHVLGGDLPVSRGEVLCAGTPIGELVPRAMARRRSALPQQVEVSFPFTVAEVVLMGRAPWQGTDAQDQDDTVVRAAMVDADVAHLAGRSVPTLSGGERSRTAFARVLAQQAQLLLLDEPTAALDLHHQELVVDIVRRRALAGDGVVVVLHDLALAAAIADRIVVLHGGSVAADGPPGDVFEEDLLSAVYGHDIEVIAHPRTGELLVLPRRPHKEIPQ